MSSVDNKISSMKRDHKSLDITPHVTIESDDKMLLHQSKHSTVIGGKITLTSQSE